MLFRSAAAEPAPTQNGRNSGRRGSGYSASHDHDFLFQARWQPVLDGPNDAMRLAQLARAMPPLCQAENGLSARLTQPRNLIDTYLNDTCDALMRSWARSKLPRLPDFVIGPFQTWLTALFSEDPNVRASYAQLQAFNSSLRAGFDSGALGFTSDGLITVRDASKVELKDRVALNSAVADDNRDRKAVYREVAVANGHPEWEEQIRGVFAKQWIASAKAGWWYESGGSWKQK